MSIELKQLINNSLHEKDLWHTNLPEKIMGSFSRILGLRVKKELKRNFGAFYIVDMSDLKLRVSSETLFFLCRCDDLTPDLSRYLFKEFESEINSSLKKNGKENFWNQLNFLVNISTSYKLLSLCQNSLQDIVVLSRQQLTEEAFFHKPRKFILKLIRKEFKISEISPYQTTAPVKEHMFFGRRSEIKSIISGAGRNFALVGGRRFGKSSLLQQLHREILRRFEIKPIFMSCDAMTDQHSLIEEIVTRIEIRESIRIRKFSFKEFLRKAHAKRGYPIIILLDELDGICKYAYESNDWTFFHAIRNANSEGYCQIIATGFKWLYKAYLDQDLPSYNFFTLHRLGNLKDQDGRDLIKIPMRDLGIHVDDDTVKYLLRQTAGQPFFLQFYCMEICSLLSNKNKNTVDLKEDICEGIERSGFFINEINNLFTFNTSPTEQLIALLALEQYSAGQVTIKFGQLYDKLKDELGGVLEKKCSFARFYRELIDLEIGGIFFIIGDTISFCYPALPNILNKHIDIPKRKEILLEQIRAKGW